MSQALIWLHEDSLRLSHPVFAAAPANCEVVFIWDDQYLLKANYSLKRLVFLYETLSELPILILRGNTLEILSQHPASQLFVPESPNPWIKSICEQLPSNKNIIQIDDEPFVTLKMNTQFRRFFQFWSKVERFAFIHDGGSNA